MAEEQDAIQGEGTEGQEEVQTVTAEQFEELRRQLEETRKSQAGSDKKVSELQRLLDEANKAKETATKSAEEQFAERLAALEKENAEARRSAQRAELKSGAMQLLSDAGLKPPAFFDRLIGDDAEATQELVSAYIEDKKATLGEGAQQFAKDNGRRVTGTETQTNNLTYEKLMRMSDQEVKSIPADVLDSIMGSAMKK